MRLFVCQLLVASSCLLAAAASAATRPQYGGTLRVSTRIVPVSLDPADSTQPDSIARHNLIGLLFDNLVTIDGAGRAQPALATSWQAEPGNQRWQLSIRQNVDFQDGSPLRPDAVAASLRLTNPAWTVYPTGNSVVIECSSPAPNLLSELALSRNAIAKRTPAGTIFGTGPFQISDWQPGSKLTLVAQEGYWGGRPFVDSVVIEMGKSVHDQMIALELGKTDLIEVAPEQVRHLSMQSRRVVTSAPLELMALVFTRDRQSPEEGRLRDALALSIDRAAMRNVLLQGQGEIAGGILPNWMSGYEFIFSSNVDLQRAQQMRGDSRQAAAWTVGYDAADPLARLVAERVALNARDAGITLQPTASSKADIRVARILLPATDSKLALASAAAALGLPQPKFAGSGAEDSFQAESRILQSQRVIPLFHLPAAAYAVGPGLRAFDVDRDGAWHLPDVWLGTP